MEIKGRVIDATNSNPLAGASITVVDANGKALGAGTSTDQYGFFILNSGQIDNNQVLISYIGFAPVIYQPSLLTQDNDVKLSPGYDELDPVVVTPRKNKWILPVVLLAGLGYIFKDDIKRQFK